MNAVFAKMIDEVVPKVNKKITDGVNADILKQCPTYINSIIMSGMRSINTDIPLVYHGWRKLMPKEEFEKIYSGKNNRVNYDIATSYLYVIELKFSYRGEPIIRYMYLPYAAEGNIMKISSTPYNIVSIMSDTVITPTHKNIFVRLHRAKLIFEKTDRNFLVNDVKTPGQIIYSDIYKTNNRNIEDKLGSAVPPVSLYILGFHGLVKSLEKYANVKGVQVLTSDAHHLMETHKVYASTKLKPKDLNESYYIGHDLKIAIPNSGINASNADFIDNFIFSVMYTIDIFPEDSAEDLVYVIQSNDLKSERLFWRILLGKIVFKNSFTVDKIAADFNDHFTTLNSYIDALLQTKLEESGIVVDNFFDLIAIIISNYNGWIINSKLYNSDLNNRYIDVLYYLMYDIVISVNKALFDINRKYNKNKKHLSFLEINKILSDIGLRKIFSILSGGLNLCLMPGGDSSPDIKYPKITSVLLDQSNGVGVKRAKTSSLPESMRFIRGTDLYVGSILFLLKSSNSPRYKKNIYMDYNENTGRVIMNDKMIKATSKLDKLLTSKIGSEVVKINMLDDEMEI